MKLGRSRDQVSHTKCNISKQTLVVDMGRKGIVKSCFCMSISLVHGK